MAGLPWFKVFSNIVGHPKTRALEEATRNSEALAYIVRLMSWFNEYAPSGRADGARTARAIERACEWGGENGALLAAFESCGWIDRDGNDLCLHDWDEVQGSHITKATKDAEAKKLKRLQAKAARRDEEEALKRRSPGAKTARAEVADGADAARLEEKIREEKREETKDLVVSAEPIEPKQSDLLPEPGPDSTGESADDLRALWNTDADPRLPRWRDMTEKRRTQAQARLRERPLAEWRIILGRINGSPFCLGQNERGWKADVEFFLRPDTATKVLEGKYDPREEHMRPRDVTRGVVRAEDMHHTGPGDLTI